MLKRLLLVAMVCTAVVMGWFLGASTPENAGVTLQVLEVRGQVALIRDGDASRLETYTSLHEGDRVETKAVSYTHLTLPTKA